MTRINNPKETMPEDKENAHSSFLSDIKYHDYVIMLCFIDAEWSLRRPADGEDVLQSYLRPLKENTHNAIALKNCVLNNYAKFRKENNVSENKPYEPHFYAPLSYIPLGHSDALSITLLDDFESVHRLSAEVTTTIEDVSLGFCPRIDSLTDINPGDKTICDLNDLLSDGHDEVYKETIEGKEHFILSFAFQKKAPLLAFTKYKIHGLGVIGQGFLFQQALYKAMIATIRETVQELHDTFDSDTSLENVISKDDIDSLRCVLLDLQGSEEIGTLMFCSNYSVILTIVSALRSMTFEDVLSKDDNTKILLDKSDLHQLVIRNSKNLQKESINSPENEYSIISHLNNNHVMRWVNSSLAVTPQSFIDQPDNCKGFVEMLWELQIPPGHMDQIQTDIATTDHDIKHDHTKSIKFVANNCSRYMVGINDYLVSLTQDGVDVRTSGLPILTLEKALSFPKEIIKNYGVSDGSLDYGRKIIDMSPIITIPVPMLSNNKVSTENDFPHYSPLAIVLSKAIKGLFKFSELPEDEKQKYGRSVGRLDILKLEKSMKKIGIPTSLRLTIKYLYQDYVNILSDPHLFDLALDLYDTFATLHSVLTDHLTIPKYPKNGAKPISTRYILDEGRVEQISYLVEVMYNALIHRMSNIYPETPLRDMAIDFRGGLNQIVHAADAPMKCGLGVMRKYVLNTQQRETVGGLTCIKFTPGAKCNTLNLGIDTKAVLGYFEMDVPHFLHATSFYDYLHESFHMIFNVLKLQHNNKSLFGNLRSPIMADRVSEVFANFMCNMFIFGKDSETFILHHVCSYSKSLVSIASDECETVIRFTEMMIRLFFAVDATMKNEKEPRFWDKEYPKKNMGTVDEALTRFETMMSTAGPLFSEYKHLWEHEEVQLYCKNQFKAIYPKFISYMPHIWRESVRIYHVFDKDSYTCDESEYNLLCKEVTSNIEEAFANGSPLIRGLYRNHLLENNDSSRINPFVNTDESCLDPLKLVCEILHIYTGSIKDARGKDIHLNRKFDEDLGDSIDYRSERGWNDFQIDIGNAASYSPVPECRKRRLKKQIVMLKTFWDISSCFRARRLRDIISDNLPANLVRNI